MPPDEQQHLRCFVVRSVTMKRDLQKMLGSDWVVLAVGDNAHGYYFTEGVLSADCWDRQASNATLKWWDEVRMRAQRWLYL